MNRGASAPFFFLYMHFSKTSRILLATLYFLFISVLFVLPGSAFPKDDWMAKIYFDKWVHIGLFAALAVAWSWALPIRQVKFLRTLFFALMFYGIMVELVQDRFVPNRSFDRGDWIADMVGSLIGIVFWYRVYIKK